MKSNRIRVYGRVQGVSFRYNTYIKANELGVKGIVKNEADGSVYIEAEGQPDVIQQFLEWCRKGPSLAKVEDILIEDKPLQHFRTFSIIR